MCRRGVSRPGLYAKHGFARRGRLARRVWRKAVCTVGVRLPAKPSSSNRFSRQGESAPVRRPFIARPRPVGRRERGNNMSYLPPLEELDRDGAIQETAAKIDGDTRTAFLRKAGLGAGAVLGSGALMGALPAVAGAASTSDVDILNFALTLEYLEAAFYAEAVSKGALSGDVKKFAQIVAGHEKAHVGFLKGALGSKAV